MPSIRLPDEVFNRIKMFCDKYNIDYSDAVSWFVLFFLDKNGNPNVDVLKIALDKLKPNEKYYTTRELSKICGVSINSIQNSIRKLCKWYGIDNRKFIHTTNKGSCYKIPYWLAMEIIQKYTSTNTLNINIDEQCSNCLINLINSFKRAIGMQCNIQSVVEDISKREGKIKMKVLKK